MPARRRPNIWRSSGFPCASSWSASWRSRCWRPAWTARAIWPDTTSSRRSRSTPTRRRAPADGSFRCFLFRGWVTSDQYGVFAVIVISQLWAALHVQYDWVGVAQVFLTGLVLGWTRWRSGSTLLTILLHLLVNLEHDLVRNVCDPGSSPGRAFFGIMLVRAARRSARTPNARSCRRGEAP